MVCSTRLELDLAQFIVLTGAQAAGKSTIAKAVYYFSLAKEICFALITGSKNRNLDILKSDLRGKFLLQTFYDLFGGMVSNSVGCLLECIYTEKTKIRIYREENAFLHIKLSENIDELVERYADKDLPYDNSQAFYVANGVVTDAMEDNLICSEFIDGASDEINSENDRLIELKWATEKQNEN